MPTIQELRQNLRKSQEIGQKSTNFGKIYIRDGTPPIGGIWDYYEDCGMYVVIYTVDGRSWVAGAAKLGEMPLQTLDGFIEYIHRTLQVDDSLWEWAAISHVYLQMKQQFRQEIGMRRWPR